MLNEILNENEKKDLIDELLSILTKENEQKLPENLTDSDKRWLLNNLMLMRTMGYLDETFLSKQDRLLSSENIAKGIIEVDNFKFKKNMMFSNLDITQLKTDAIVIFTSSLFGKLYNHIKCIDNTILLKGGLQINEDLTFLLRASNGLIDYRAPYIVEGHNLPTRNIVKIMLSELYSDFTQIEKDRLKDCLNNLFKIAKENQWKSIAFELSEFPYGYPKDVMKTIIINECKNLNKIYKTKMNMIFSE